MKRSGLSRTIVAIAMMFIGWLPSLAHNFEVDGIFYIKTSGNTVAVTYKGYSQSSYSNEYAGDVVIPSSVDYNGATYSVTRIGFEAFYNCSSLTSIQIPNSVTRIGDFAFFDCTSLTSIEIPNSVTSIGNYAFCDCYSLTSIQIPNSITSIGKWAFNGCTSLTEITCLATTPPTIESNTFSNYSADLYVPAGCKEAYEAAEYWNKFTNIIELEPELEEGATFEYEGLTYKVVVKGEELAVIASKNGKYSGDIVIPSSVDYNGTTYSVTSIGDDAFSGCSSLTKITCLATNPPAIEFDSFTNYSADLYVPIGCKSAYKSAEYWNDFNNIFEFSSSATYEHP